MVSFLILIYDAIVAIIYIIDIQYPLVSKHKAGRKDDLLYIISIFSPHSAQGK